MHEHETPSPPRYTGHVKNGVIVLDARAGLSEGRAVQVEPLDPTAATQERLARYGRAFQAIEAWSREDPDYTERVATKLAEELPPDHGVRFRDVSITPEP